MKTMSDNSRNQNLLIVTFEDYRLEWVFYINTYFQKRGYFRPTAGLSVHCEQVLVACTQLYNPLRWYIRRLVGRPVTTFILSLLYDFRALLLLPNRTRQFSRVSGLVYLSLYDHSNITDVLDVP